MLTYSQMKWTLKGPMHTVVDVVEGEYGLMIFITRSVGWFKPNTVHVTYTISGKELESRLSGISAISPQWRQVVCADNSARFVRTTEETSSYCDSLAIAYRKSLK